MGIIRQLLTGRRHPSSSHHSPPPSPPPPHALDTLPSLPHPRRPLTPTPPHPQHLTSPFFRLPPELRQIIYRLVLTHPSPHTEIHIDMRYTAASTSTPHSTAGATLASHRSWRWRASNCHRHPSSPALADRCGWGGPPPTACALFPDTPCAVGREVLGLLLCCRAAYREAVQVLYAENTFHVSTGAVVLYTDRLLPAERAGAVTSLVYRVTEDMAWHYAAEHLGLVPGLPAYAAMLVRVPGAFPGLRRLLVVVQGLLAVRGLLERGVRFGGREPPDRDATRVCMLSSMDAVARSFAVRGRPLDECVLALGAAAFDDVMEGEREKAEREEVREGEWVQFWHPVRAVVRAGGEEVQTGYWVRRVAPEETSGLTLDFEAVALALPP